MTDWIAGIVAGLVGFLLAWLIIPTAAPAQQPANHEAQAIGNKLIHEINAGIQCGTALLQAQAEVKRLTEKYESKKD